MKAISSGISLRALGYLVALSEERHFGRAAQRCLVSQPTLSAQVKKMEDLLGVQLVERSQRHVMLTDVGEEVVARARKVLSGVGEICALAESRRDPLAGQLRVGLIPTVAPYLLPHAAPVLRAELPALRLMLFEHQTHELLRRLDDGSIDMAILALPVDAEGLDLEPIFEEAFVAAMPADHALSMRKELRVSDLDDQPLLLLEDGHCLRDQALEICSRIRVREPQDFRATSLETLRQMVAAGVGVTLLPALATLNAGPDAAVLTRPFRAPQPYRTIAGAWRRTSARADAMQAICRVIRTGMGGVAPGIRIA
jgi:LysR family hydrogen peroxide-inducible transcriptional activator